MSREARAAIQAATYEYLLITLPVALYVGLEAVHREDWTFFINSPEWSIATVFLTFQAFALYLQKLKKTGRRLSDPALSIVALLGLVLIVAASANAYGNLEQVTLASARIRVGLFLIASSAFLLMVSGAERVHFHLKRKHGQ